ncbi:MAG: hypothetical protein A3H96_11920 [Acidobacteria bacterium RIFCSPLOWO2_02_FULL_67_36]|nr:MAG: hypothetical protein A3H96_11920 [Acidobacteria bacterium RIFCSPLOWO2_02_FULL_67_36]OFW18595.1 MAG: hypothetical protein A3G21_21220 [Acidobacteria bacterium RIFCSPLOWO2_12_FULL_66_21]
MKRHNRAFACIAALVLFGGAAAAQDDLSSPKLRIEWTAFKKLYDAKSVVVVDVRDAISYESGHIPRARLIPYDQVEKRVAELKKIKQPIVLYCA